LYIGQYISQLNKSKKIATLEPWKSGFKNQQSLTSDCFDLNFSFLPLGNRYQKMKQGQQAKIKASYCCRGQRSGKEGLSDP